MRIGWGLPVMGVMGTREHILTLAREAEQLGYHSVWSAQRLLYPTQPRQNFNGAAWPAIYQQSLDTLGMLIFVAAVTEKVRLGTSTLNLAFYQPVHLAKAIATLDVLSNGRAVICAGQGWSEDEFIVSGVPFSQRTGRLVEMIEALNTLWGPDPVEFHGKYYEVPAAMFNPKPLQKPHPPLLFAATAPAALARAARLSDGFNPIAGPNAADTERSLAAALELIVRVNHVQVTDQPIEADRKLLIGSIEQIREDVELLAAWGATEVLFSTIRLGQGQPDALKLQLDQMTKLRGVIE